MAAGSGTITLMTGSKSYAHCERSDRGEYDQSGGRAPVDRIFLRRGTTVRPLPTRDSKLVTNCVEVRSNRILQGRRRSRWAMMRTGNRKLTACQLPCDFESLGRQPGAPGLHHQTCCGFNRHAFALPRQAIVVSHV